MSTFPIRYDLSAIRNSPRSRPGWLDGDGFGCCDTGLRIVVCIISALTISPITAWLMLNMYIFQASPTGCYQVSDHVDAAVGNELTSLARLQE